MKTPEQLRELADRLDGPKGNPVSAPLASTVATEVRSIASALEAVSVEPVARYEPVVVVAEDRGRTTATGAAMRAEEDGRWVQFSAIEPLALRLGEALRQRDRLAEALLHLVSCADACIAVGKGETIEPGCALMNDCRAALKEISDGK